MLSKQEQCWKQHIGTNFSWLGRNEFFCSKTLLTLIFGKIPHFHKELSPFVQKIIVLRKENKVTNEINVVQNENVIFNKKVRSHWKSVKKLVKESLFSHSGFSRFFPVKVCNKENVEKKMSSSRWDFLPKLQSFGEVPIIW